MAHERSVSWEKIRMLSVDHLQIIPAASLHLTAFLIEQHRAAEFIKDDRIHFWVEQSYLNLS